jgi:hypothetical protein
VLILNNNESEFIFMIEKEHKTKKVNIPTTTPYFEKERKKR